MSRFDMFARALAVGHFREALSAFFEDGAQPPGQHCQNFSCAGSKNNCGGGCKCNENTGTCVAHK